MGMILSLLTPLKALLKTIPVWAWALAAVLAWGAYQKSSATRATKAAAQHEQRAAVEAATAKAEREARDTEQKFADNARKAADEYASNLARKQRDAANARAGLDGLRNAIAATPACPIASGPSGPVRLDAIGGVYAELLGNCASTLQDLAAEADRLEAKLTGLQGYVNATRPKP